MPEGQNMSVEKDQRISKLAQTTLETFKTGRHDRHGCRRRNRYNGCRCGIFVEA